MNSEYFIHAILTNKRLNQNEIQDIKIWLI